MEIPMFIIIVLCLIAVLLFQAVRCHRARLRSIARLKGFQTKSVLLTRGETTYIDEGEGEVILSIHGIFGGYDQAYETCQDFRKQFRIIAPSRFGYPGSDCPQECSPHEQAAALAELLDELGIRKVNVLGTSAGGTIAIRFALDYPGRTNRLILYCSAMPYPEKPAVYADYAGPPGFLIHDYPLLLISPFFKMIMGMDPKTIHTMLPVAFRRKGVRVDAGITNPDMARNYDGYPVENLRMPILILHAKDDQLARFSAVEAALPRFRDPEFIRFEEGGHLMKGHAESIRQSVLKFMAKPPV